MKKILAIAITVLLSSAFAKADPQPQEVTVGISGAYVPAGFDSTSDAYVVVNGVFQNGCYKWSRAEQVTRDTFTHEIKTIATVTPGMCIMVLIPYQKEVRLGQLPSGKHTLRFLNGDGTYLEKTLNVE